MKLDVKQLVFKNNPKRKETMSNVISGVFCYAVVTEPRNKYQSEEKEYSIDIVVDEETFDNFGDSYPKQKGKSVKTSEFKEIYKIDPPFPGEKKQYILKLKKAATFKDRTTGETKMLAKPQVLLKKNNKATMMPENILIGNGSTGKVSFEEKENSYGTFAKLKAVLVENLIEYKSASKNAADDFGLETFVEGSEDFADNDGKQVKVPEKAKIAAQKKSAAVEDDDCPF